MLIAVTGGSGALGRELVAELAARGHDVRSVSRSAPARLPAGAEHVRADLLDGSGLDAALAGADAVIDAVKAGPATKAAREVLVGHAPVARRRGAGGGRAPRRDLDRRRRPRPLGLQRRQARA